MGRRYGYRRGRKNSGRRLLFEVCPELSIIQLRRGKALFLQAGHQPAQVEEVVSLPKRTANNSWISTAQQDAVLLVSDIDPTLHNCIYIICAIAFSFSNMPPSKETLNKLFSSRIVYCPKAAKYLVAEGQHFLTAPEGARLMPIPIGCIGVTSGPSSPKVWIFPENELYKAFPGEEMPIWVIFENGDIARTSQSPPNGSLRANEIGWLITQKNGFVTSVQPGCPLIIGERI
jgi:hypothetical protein